MKQQLYASLDKIKYYLSVPQVYRSLPIVTLLLGIWVGGSVAQQLAARQTTEEIRDDETSYKYINPLLECESASISSNGTLTPIKNAIEDYTREQKNIGALEHSSVYFRDLNNGPWFGIDLEEEFSPASLVKVPLMLAYFRISESDPAILAKELVVQNVEEYQVQNIVPEVQLEVGKKYPVKELIARMMKYSDNVAFQVLYENLGFEEYERVFIDLGIDIHQEMIDDPNGNIITVRDYAAFFRILFNASYLDASNSEEALRLMTQSSFRGGIAAGVDPGVEVSHKFGERVFTFSGIRQFHDCGIVYAGQNPYLLCVMTRGTDIDKLTNYVQEVSRIVYREYTGTEQAE